MFDIVSIIVDGVLWVVSVTIAGFAGFIARELLPNKIKAKVSFSSKRVKIWHNNYKYKISIYKKINISDSRKKGEVVDQISSSINQEPDNDGDFLFRRQVQAEEMEIKIRTEEPLLQKRNEASVCYDQVESVLIEINSSPSYRNLQDTLLDIQDVESELISSIPFKHEQVESRASCKLPGTPSAVDMFRQGDFTRVTAEVEEGAKIDLTNEEVQIDADNSSVLSSILKKSIIYYG